MSAAGSAVVSSSSAAHCCPEAGRADMRADIPHDAFIDDIDTHAAAARASVRSVAGHGQVQLRVQLCSLAPLF